MSFLRRRLLPSRIEPVPEASAKRRRAKRDSTGDGAGTPDFDPAGSLPGSRPGSGSGRYRGVTPETVSVPGPCRWGRGFREARRIGPAPFRRRAGDPPHGADVRADDPPGGPRSLRRRKIVQDTRADGRAGSDARMGTSTGAPQCAMAPGHSRGSEASGKTPDGSDSGHVPLASRRPYTARSGCRRLMFSARHTKSHSPRALFRPRTLNRRNPRTSLIQPLGASDSHLRCA